ncbi:DUF1648 domain-containing protein [Pseudalkalibacillus sp. NRS-1564]|uniref:DUF1648 domain-containing protein n=1 Tax=Pseudalkalibacillus sp. NRS-1564 TaxID=3233900 RepID=UPI003D2AECBD
MTDRPIIKIEKSILQKLFDIAGLVFLCLSLGYLLLNWSGLPSEVPIHFDVAGQADHWGSKLVLFFLPIFGILLWGGLSMLERYPHVFNYVVHITKGNAELQYRTAVALIHFLKNTIALMFSVITIETISMANGSQVGLIPWILPVFLTLIFGSIIICIIQSIRWR